MDAESETLVPIGGSFDTEVTLPLSASMGRRNAGPQGRENGELVVAQTLASTMSKGIVRGGNSSGDITNGILNKSGVRRLMPVECERLQGFPDNYTQVPYHKKASKDGPRYKAIGNSIAVPVIRWIGKRIQKVDSIISQLAPPEPPC